MKIHHASPTTFTARTTRLVALPVIAAAGALTASHAVAGAAEPAITCGSVVTTDIRLTADLLDCPGSGLVVGAPDITVDLAGHVVDGTGSGAGIDNEAGHDGVRMVGGTVRDFVFGVILFQADGARVERLAVVANLDGVSIASSTAVEVDRVTARDNVGPGIEITFSDRVTVRRSIAADNGLWGIVDRFSTRSRHEHNTVTGNAAPGLTLDRTGGAVVERNQVGTNDIGIELVAIDDAVVVRNATIANRGDGISVDRPGNTLTANRTADNGGAGIAAPDGTIDGGRNRARGNLGGDCTGVVCR